MHPRCMLDEVEANRSEEKGCTFEFVEKRAFKMLLALEILPKRRRDPAVDGVIIPPQL